MEMSLNQAPMQEMLQVIGGCTESVFKAAEAFLQANADHQNALERIAPKATMNRYVSMMDFVFCEIFTDYRKHCKLFYNDKGPPLREMATPGQVEYWDNVLLMALKFAYELFSQHRMKGWCWTKFRYEVLVRAAA